MLLGKKIIEELQKAGYKAVFARITSRNIFLNISEHNNIYIATSANLSKIRDICKSMNLVCKIHTKINKMTTELIINNKYIIFPFLKIRIKNNYASRKYSTDLNEAIKSQTYTLDALMYDPVNEKFIDTVMAKDDINNKIIKLNGKPFQKIIENRLVLVEAGYFLALLGNSWSVDYDSFKEIKNHSLEITIVSNESIRNYFIKLIKYTDKPSLAFRFFESSGILKELMPEILHSIGIIQSNKSNNLDLFNHIMFTLDSISRKQHNFEILRWSAIFHDIGKPYTKNYDSKGNLHFFGHDKIGAIFASRWLNKYDFDKFLIYKVCLLCKNHLFDASLDNITIKRLINRVGKSNIFDLLNLRIADRHGTGRKNISMKRIEMLKKRIKKILDS